MTDQSAELDLESPRAVCALLIAVTQDDAKTVDLICDTCDLRSALIWAVAMAAGWIARAGCEPVQFGRGVITQTISEEADHG